MKWQPIETAPMDSNILGWNQYDGVLVYRPMYYSSKNFAGWDAVYDTETLADAPTHWMPLPEAPVSTNKGTDMEKAYSTNGEEYRYGDADEALQAMADDDALREGATYYEIDTEAVQLADYLRADRILEAAEESLYDDIGEAAEDAFAANKEAMDELSSLLSAWTEKHLSGHYWKCVGKARELKVTAADVAEYAP